MTNSIQVAVSDGTMTILDISIEYLDRSEITVLFDDVITTQWEWVGVSEKRITFDGPPVLGGGPVPNGVQVKVKRTTDATGLRHEFSGGAKFNAQTLDEDLIQILHIAQEAQESAPSGDFFQGINMHGYGIHNLADGSLPGDAVTYGQYTSDVVGIGQAVVDAEAAAAAAQAAAGTFGPDLANTADLVKGDALVGVKHPSAGSTARTQHSKNTDVVSFLDFGGSSANSAGANATAAAAAEAAASDVLLPPGAYSFSGSYSFSRPWYGSGTVSYSGISSAVFAGGGLNDATFGGTYAGVRPLSIVVKINTTGTPDTLAVSFNGGATFVTTQDVYDPGTDSYITGPINIVAGAMPVFATGITMTFGVTTGHNLGATWTFMARPTPLMGNTNGRSYALAGVPFVGAFGTKCTFLGKNTFGNNNAVGVENTAIGENVLKDAANGYANTGVGVDVMQALNSGFFNQGYGAQCLRAVTSGYNNSGYGTYCLTSLTTGRDNTAYGVDSQVYATTAQENTSAGVQSLYHNRIGVMNAAYGLYASRGGVESLSNGFSVNYSSAFGARALYYARGDFNTGIGFEAGYNTIGAHNVYVGNAAGFRITSGTYNVFVGDSAGVNVLQKVDAVNSIAIGDNAYTTGDNGIAIGSASVAGANEIVLGNGTHFRVRPMVDNNTNLGQSTFRWATVFAATGTISTSDERHKQSIEGIPELWLDAWESVEWVRYKFNYAVDKKGTDARWHVGLIAQRVHDAFAAVGVDAFKIGLLTYDEWEANELHDAGNIWGVRYDEAQAIEAAYVRREIRRLRTGG